MPSEGFDKHGINVSIPCYGDFEMVRRAVASVPDWMDIHIIDGRDATFPQIDGSDTTVGLREWCDSHEQAIYHAPPEDDLPFGVEECDPEIREDAQEHARFWFHDSDVLPQDEWTIKLDSDEIMVNMERESFRDADPERVYRPNWWSDDGRYGISPRIRMPKHWTFCFPDVPLPRDRISRDASYEEMYEAKKAFQIDTGEISTLPEVVITHHGHDRSDTYMQARMEQLEVIGRHYRATELGEAHGLLSDVKRVAYITNFAGVDGGAGQAQRVLRELVKERDILPVGIQAGESGLGVPTNITIQQSEYGHPIILPHDFEETLSEIAPDAVIVHTYGVDLHRKLRGIAESGVVDTKWIYKNGANLFELWGNQMAKNRPGYLGVTLTELDWFDMILCSTPPLAETMQVLYGGAVGHNDGNGDGEGEDAPQIWATPGGVNPDLYYNEREWMEDGVLKVVIASRFSPNAFHLAPLVALNRLRDDVPVSLRLMGSGASQLIGTVARYTEGRDWIEYLGHQPVSAVRDHLAEADVACVPGVSHQGVPATAIEAMAAGCCVVIDDMPAAREVTKAIHVDIAHPPAWYDALVELVENPDLASRLGEMAREEIAATRNVRENVSKGHAEAIRQVTSTRTQIRTENLRGGE